MNRKKCYDSAMPKPPLTITQVNEEVRNVYTEVLLQRKRNPHRKSDLKAEELQALLDGLKTFPKAARADILSRLQGRIQRRRRSKEIQEILRATLGREIKFNAVRRKSR